MKSLMLVFFLAANALAIPQLINYQGMLTSPAGTPLDTTVAIMFRIYATSVGGAAVWTEVHQSITVTDGLFHVLLGSVTTLPDSFAVNRWLGVTVGSNSEMTPRQQVVSVAHAYRVGTVDGASGGTITGDVRVVGRGNFGTATDNSGLFSFVAGDHDTASGLWSVVNGGANNVASGTGSAIGGGRNNVARGAFSTIGGGGDSLFSSSNSTDGPYSVIAGGISNYISNSGTTAGVISGGRYNSIEDGEDHVIGGGQGNIATGIAGATIAGGANNSAFRYAAVGGGYGNAASGSESTVSGGEFCIASALGATVGGGFRNRARGEFSTVDGGGGVSQTDSNSASGDYSTIGGGRGNLAGGISSTISGGNFNRARGNYAVVAGGGGASFADSNTAIGENSVVSGGGANDALGAHSVVSGGYDNDISGSAHYSVINGGVHNSVDETFSVICGGTDNVVSGRYSAVLGGHDNVAGGWYASVLGGTFNSADGAHSYVLGKNLAATGNYSIVCGSNASASADSCFVWSDGSGPTFSIGADNTYNVKANGGVRFWTTADHAANIGTRLAAGGSSWIALSDSNMKTNREHVDGKGLLQKISDMPIDKWNYKHQADGPKHIGPMAQDFHNAFGLGEDELGIETIDADGVLFAAVQELAKRNDELTRVNEQQATEIAELKQLVNQVIALGHK